MRGFRRSDDIFREFERMFQEIERRMHEMINEAFSPEAWKMMPEELENNPYVKTYYWGYRAEIGPDGVPRIETFGNIPTPSLPMNSTEEVVETTPTAPVSPEMQGTRLGAEPVTDIIVDEQDGLIRVIMELPGVTERDVKLDVSESTLKVEATNEFKRFYKEVTFPKTIDPKTVKKSLKNGILELKFKFRNGNDNKRRFRIRLP